MEFRGQNGGKGGGALIVGKGGQERRCSWGTCTIHLSSFEWKSDGGMKGNLFLMSTHSKE